MASEAQGAAAGATRFRVHGRVQGVGFRAATRREARRLGLDGHALNLPDGSVEVIAEGAPEALQALASWLHRGPPLAHVERVEASVLVAEGRRGFDIG